VSPANGPIGFAIDLRQAEGTGVEAEEGAVGMSPTATGARARSRAERDAARPSSSRVRALVFGSFCVVTNGTELSARDFGGVKPKQILEILLAARGRPVPKDRLADYLWGEALPQNISATLETYVSVLRRRLDPSGRGGHEIVRTEQAAYRIPREAVELDLDVFDELVTEASSSDLPRRRRLLEEAMRLVRGEVFEDEPYAPWAEAIRDTYERRHIQALIDASEAAVLEGDRHVGADYALEATAMDPLNERGYRALMLATYALGQQEAALRAFERCRSVLAFEFGVDPLDQTMELLAAIQRHDHPEALVRRVLRSSA
jgi:DNA-binding SARP family transcriptional activator